MDLFTQISEAIQLVSVVLMGLAVVATAVSRITFWTDKDNKLVDSATGKLISFLPTFGKDARTKQLEALVEQLKGNKPNEAPAVTEVKAS